MSDDNVTAEEHLRRIDEKIAQLEATPAEPEREPTQDEKFLAEMKRRNADQWSDTGSGLLDR